MAATDIVSLSDAKTHLNIDLSNTTSDTELAGFISAATGPVEKYVGAVINRTVTEVRDGGRADVVLTTLPVVSITSVVDTGTTLTTDEYTINLTSGVLSRVAGPSLLPFLPGVQSVTVTYVAGQAAAIANVPGNIRLAALVIIQHLWETQRPAATGPFTQGADDYDPRYSYSVPRRALELLGEPVGGFA